MKTILFQGDSITDAIRVRDNDGFAGCGYPTMVTGTLMARYPGQYKCLNRGISGNRIVDILCRMRSDIENLEPDVMSLLIGVNDVWHEIDHRNGVPVERFERVLSLLLDEMQTSMPDLKLMLLEPFVLEGTATRPTAEDPMRYEKFRAGVTARAEIVHRQAEKHGCVFVPLQAKLDDLAAQYGPENWLLDGVHPSAGGHQVITEEWLKAFATLKL